MSEKERINIPDKRLIRSAAGRCRVGRGRSSVIEFVDQRQHFCDLATFLKARLVLSAAPTWAGL